MKSLKITIVAAAAALATAGSASAGVTPMPAADNGASAKLISTVYSPAAPAQLEKAQWVYGGYNYCWYPGGWHGPGYYRCGWAWRRGYGWGGPIGWHGWGGGGWHRGWGRGPGWHGGWHRGGWHRGWHR